MSLGISFLRVDETWEKHRILDEENWRVVAYEVPNAFFGVEFDGKTTWISAKPIKKLNSENKYFFFLTNLKVSFG